MSTMPHPGGLYDRFQIIMRFPPQLTLGLATIRPNSSRVARAPCCELDRKIDATDPLGCLYYLSHGTSLARSKIVCRTPLGMRQVFQRSHMSDREVDHVDKIS